MKIFNFIVIFLLLNNFVFSSEIDSLENLLKNKNIDKVLKSEILNKLSEFYEIKFYENKDILIKRESLAFKVIEKSKKSLELSPDFKKEETIKRIAEIYFEIKIFKESLNFFDKLLKIQKKGSIKKSYTLLKVGQIYYEWGFFEKAIKNFLLSLKITQELREIKKSIKTLNHIAFAYIKIRGDKINSALVYQKQALSMAEKLNNKKEISECQNNLGIIYSIKKEFEEALKYTKKAFKIKNEINDSIGIAKVNENFGDIYIGKKNLERALDYYNRAYFILNKKKDSYGTAAILLKITVVNTKLNNLEDALLTTNLALEIALEIQAHEIVMNIYENGIEIYKKKKNIEELSTYYKNYISARDSVLRYKNRNNIYEMEIKYEKEKEKEDEIKALNLNNEKKFRDIIIIAFLLVLSLVTIIFVILIKRNKATKKNEAKVHEIIRGNNKELSKKNEELTKQKDKLKEQEDKLKNINLKLTEKVAKEVKKSREKDHILAIKSRQAAMGEMIGNIAHQWRQPLNSIGLIVQDVEDAYEYEELNKEYLHNSVSEMMEIIKYMSQTIDDFRSFFKPDREKLKFNVKNNIGKSVSLLQATFKNNNIDLNIDINKGIFILGYPNEFSQVIINILNNAKDIILERKIEKGKVMIKSFYHFKDTIISITDNAGGISQKIIDKIFNPYFTTKHESQGTGIGLHMAKSIIEKNMGGFLQVQNTKDGAEFRIIFKSYQMSKK